METDLDIGHLEQSLNIQSIHLSALRLNPTNSRTNHDIEGKAKSLEKYGLYKPIVVHKGMIVAGNGTFLSAKHLGWHYIQCNVLPDDTPQEVVDGIGLNDNREYSDPDNENIVAILQSLEGTDLPTGYSDEDLQELLAGLEPEGVEGEGKDAEPQTSKADELREVWGTKLGQLWQIGEHRLIIGDCTDKIIVDKLMSEDTATFSFTDPPYNVGIDYGKGTDDNQGKDEFVKWCKGWLKFCPSRLLMTVGIKRLLWWGEISGDPKWIIAWVKMNGQGNTGLGGTNKWDSILVYGVEPDNNIDVIEINNDYSEGIKSDGGHPAAKPVKLWENIILRFSKTGEVIYEPFGGSGTTMVACDNLKRICRMAEISPAYAAVILQRMTDIGLTPELLP